MSSWKHKARARFSVGQSAPKWHRMYLEDTECLDEHHFRLRRDVTVDLIARCVPRDARIVDLGCGAGPLVAALTERGYRPLGLDYSHDMLTFAAERVRGSGAPTYWLTEGDIESVPLADASVDCAICLGVISYVEQPVNALREIHRILKPGAIAVISFRNRFGRLWTNPVLVARQLARSITGTGRPGEAKAIGQFLDPREVRRAILAAGLRIDGFRGIGIGPFRIGRRELLGGRAAIRVSDALTSAAGRLSGDLLLRWVSDVNIFVCSRPGHASEGSRSPGEQASTHLMEV